MPQVTFIGGPLNQERLVIDTIVDTIFTTVSGTRIKLVNGHQKPSIPHVKYILWNEMEPIVYVDMSDVKNNGVNVLVQANGSVKNG